MTMPVCHLIPRSQYVGTLPDMIPMAIREYRRRRLFGRDRDTGLDQAEQHDLAVGLIGIIHGRLTGESQGVVTRR